MKAGLIGENIAASLTPTMHEAEAKAIGFDYSYQRIDTTEEPYRGRPLRDILDEAQARGFAGLNVTHPFKVEAAGLMDELSTSARDLSAVNTVVFRDGQKVGHNTDYVGFCSAMQRDFVGLGLNRVLLLGAGGAGKAVALALVDQGVGELEIFDLDQAKARELAGRLKSLRPTAIIRPLDEVSKSAPDGVVNATPLGMQSHPGMAIDPALLQPNTWVGDIVYFPLQTQLLTRAKAHGCPVVTGAGMAVFQAVESFALITGRSPDPGRMQTHFDKAQAATPKPHTLA